MKNFKFMLILILSLIMIFSLAACDKQNNNSTLSSEEENKDSTLSNEEENNTYEFKANSSLNKYIDNNILSDVLESDIGAAPPRLSFMNERYMGILNYNGLLIYDIGGAKFFTAIEIKGLGFNQVQGSEALMLESNNDYLVLYKVGAKNGYIYSFDENGLSEIEDVSVADVKQATRGRQEESDIKLKLDKESSDINVIKYDNSFGVLVLDYADLGNSDILLLDNKLDIVTEFKMKNK